MAAVNQMFKEFEEASKEGEAPGQSSPGAGPEPELNEFLKKMTKDLFAGDGAAGGVPGMGGMDKFMDEF